MVHSLEMPSEDVNAIETLKGESSSEYQPAKTIEQLEELCDGEEGLIELLEEMLSYCARYTVTVARFKEIALQSEGTLTEARKEIDQVRGTTHDATINSINTFSRALAKFGKDNSWVGDFASDRTKYARFALAVTLSRV